MNAPPSLKRGSVFCLREMGVGFEMRFAVAGRTGAFGAIAKSDFRMFFVRYAAGCAGVERFVLTGEFLRFALHPPTPRAHGKQNIPTKKDEIIHHRSPNQPARQPIPKQHLIAVKNPR